MHKSIMYNSNKIMVIFTPQRYMENIAEIRKMFISEVLHTALVANLPRDPT